MSKPPNSKPARPIAPEHNLACGRVVVRGTDTPIERVTAHLHLIHPDGRRLSLGSVPVIGGRFEIRYADDDFPGAASRSRDVQVSISAPPSATGAESVLARTEVRNGAARSEYFLIAIDAERAIKQGGPAALIAAAASGDAGIAARAVAVGRRKSLDRRERITTERRKAVEEARTRDAGFGNAIRERIVAQVTGVAPGSERWLRMVGPADDVDTITRRYQSKALHRSPPDASAPTVADLLDRGARTYLVLSDGELQALGTPPDPDKVEQLLRKTRSGGISRDDALAICRPDRLAEPVTTPPASSTPDPQDPPPTAAADDKVDELIRAMSAPDTLTLEGPRGEGEVASRVLGLSIAKGPADVPAYYDFHRLEIAFDHVWEDARAEGYVETAKALFRAVEELGGDPEAALESNEAPLRALQREVRLAQRANAQAMPASGPGWIAKDQPLPFNTPGYGARLGFEDYILEIDPTLPPLPPLPLPPTHGDVGPGLLLDPGKALPTEANDYPFTVFAAGSVNFGLLVTYQQCFDPRDYQVGRLVGTRTLGPKESYSFTTRRVVKTSHNRKQMEANQQSRRDEAEDSYRDEAEIVSRAQAKTNFAMTTSGGYDLGPFGEGTVTTALGKDAEVSSQETKRSQRSAVRKVAQELRNEQRMEIESATALETETVEKREIVNPNDELAMTCVFYELQRQFILSEQLHRVTPVALVAQPVPRPHEVNEDWVLRHDWILRRFLPDDSFQSALTYLSTRAAGDAIVLADLKENMVRSRAAADSLKFQIGGVRRRAEQQLAALQSFVNKKSKIADENESEGWLEGAWEAAAGEAESIEGIRILEEATRERYEKAVRDEQDLRMRLERETTALQVATDAYVAALAEHANRRVEVDRLLKHIRAFILHYMQGIWSYEHPDQRFFRQHLLTVPRLIPLRRDYELEALPGWPVGVTPEPGKRCFRVTFTTSVSPDVDSDDNRATLAELVDLDRMLGFKGNYIIYPLKESNGLTDYMMTPYLDSKLGVRDPDDVGNWTLDAFTAYVECLRHKLNEQEFAEIEPALQEQRKKLLMSPHRNGERIVIPSNSLYMQLLVDSGKVLEGFKEAHRLMDIMKVKAEVRSAELDNLRRAKLVLSNQLEDPNIESVKNVYYRGAPPHDGDE
ncbi:MAG TPA: hypothetical protein VF603_03205 [Allosphingosinicella sp.]|jgi:hypothetical protein